ncbi:PDS5 [Malassezia furfur]|nr:PDS5 [Malassezia furfur]
MTPARLDGPAARRAALAAREPARAAELLAPFWMHDVPEDVFLGDPRRAALDARRRAAREAAVPQYLVNDRWDDAAALVARTDWGARDLTGLPYVAVLAFLYYAGLVHARHDDLAAAIEAWDMLDAFRKLILAHLLCGDAVDAETLLRGLSASLRPQYVRQAQPYLALARSYGRRADAEQVRTLLATHRDQFVADANLGLVERCVAQQPQRSLEALARVYACVPLEAVAAYLDCTPDEARVYAARAPHVAADEITCADATRTRSTMARERALRFRGRLSAKDAPDVVLERVQALRRELAATEQDTLDTKHLDPYCDALKKSEFLQHPRAAVRASVACCLSDMLRLYAPNAPFSEAEIAQIFAQFLAQLTEPGSSLADRDAELYADKVYVLQSLSTVKSVALVCDVHGASKLISSYFAQLMALGAHELATNVELYVVDVLVQLVEESASLPRAAIDTLLAAFDDDAPPAQHRIAVAVCRATEDRLQKHVAQALSASIRGAAQRDARAAVHARIVRIAASLEAELASDDAEVRQLATRVLASLFALDRASFAAQYTSAWRAWKGRAVDRHAGVRTDWVDGAWAVVTHHASLAAELGETLGRRASDPEERVRVAVARGARALDYETLRHHVPRVVLEQLAQRGKDKRAAVREAALDAVGHAYALAYPELRRDPGATEHFSWIPRAVLPCALAGTGDVVHSVAQTLDTHLVPFDEPAAYAARLVYVYRTLDDEARAALYYFTNLRLARPTACDAFLAAWADGDVRDVVRPVCALLRTDAAADLEALGAWRSDAAQAHARTAFDAHTSAADAHAACAAALELVRAHDAALEPTCAAFLRAGSYPVLNTSLVLPLLDAGDDAAPLRTYLARDAPQLLAPHAAALAARTQAGSVAALELLAALAAHTHVDVPDALRDALRAWCDDERDAYDATATPLAAQVLACTHDPALTHVVHALESRAALGTVDDQAAAYTALGAVAAHAPDAVALDALAEQITALLRAPWAAPDAPAWHATPPALHVRLAALAALARVCAAAHDAARARPVVQLLLHIAQRGEPRADVQTPPRAAARLRLAAAEELVRLAETNAYAPLVGARLARLAHVLQDEAFEVRAGFLHTLLAARTRRAVPAAFEAALYLVALDPEDEVRARVAAYARRAAAQGAAPEAQAARLLHLLAHHPDLATDDDEALVSFGTYVAFFAACVATQDNVAALVHVARAVHHAADATDARTSDALSLVGAIAERVLQHTADTHGWAVRPLADAEAAAHTLPPELFAARTAPAPTLPARAPSASCTARYVCH